MLVKQVTSYHFDITADKGPRLTQTLFCPFATTRALTNFSREVFVGLTGIDISIDIGPDTTLRCVPTDNVNRTSEPVSNSIDEQT